MPKFQKEFPKDAMQYLNSASDEAFKKKHPIGYGVLVACGLGALVLPMIILLLVTAIWFPAPNSGFLLLAMVGCFIIGIGLFNIVAAWIGQYLGHKVTIGCFLVGGILVLISCVIMYIPEVYALFDEQIVSYYFFTMLFLALPPVFYLPFRLAVDSWLRRKRIGKNRIKKLKKGMMNFWWYEALHKECNLGLIYHLNRLVTIVYVFDLILALTLGWLRFMVPVVSGLYGVVSILMSVLSLFSSVQENMDSYGTPVVILRRTRNHGYTSSLLDMARAAFPLMAGYASILMMLDVMGIPR